MLVEGRQTTTQQTHHHPLQRSEKKTRHNRQNLEARRLPRGIWSKLGPTVWLQSAAGDVTVAGGAATRTIRCEFRRVGNNVSPFSKPTTEHVMF
jgi:hypothetical protein